MDSFYSFALSFADQHHILAWCALGLLGHNDALRIKEVG